MNAKSHHFYDLDLDAARNLLTFLWKEETAEMSDEDFKDGLRDFALTAARHGVTRLLVDLRKFRHRPGDEAMAWRGTEVTPLYHLIGVRRFAYVMPEGAPAPPADAPDRNPGENFPTRYFARQAEAEAWLTA